MDKDKKQEQHEQEDDKLSKKQKQKKVDEEVKESFPASDPPSYSNPGKEDIKDPKN